MRLTSTLIVGVLLLACEEHNPAIRPYDADPSAPQDGQLTPDVTPDIAPYTPLDLGPIVDEGSGDAEVVTPDGSVDEGVVDPDDGVAPPDEGVVDPDDGVTPPDEGVVDPDDGVDPPDEGVVDPDDGVDPPDEGVVDPDGGVDPPDEGVVDPDDGVPPPDEGVIDPDEGVDPDAEPDAAPCLEDCDNDGVSVAQGDCDDGDPLINPNAIETCDGVDNDCDEIIDDVVRQCYTGDEALIGLGLCAAGFEACVDGAFGGPCIDEVLPIDEVCGDGVDNDCDQQIDEGCDGDGDGFTVDQGDCRDDDPLINPDAEEVCDGVDNDCDEVTDQIQRPCYDGDAGTEGEGICEGGSARCVAGAWGACEGQTLPGQELCDNGLDDDCDGDTDEGCAGNTCPDVDLDSLVALSTTCLTTHSSGYGLVTVDLRDTSGDPLVGVPIEITSAPAINMFSQRQSEHIGFRIFTAPNIEGEVTFTATVPCEDGQRIALRTQPTLEIRPGLAPTGAITTGGCPLDGNLQVQIRDAETGEAVPAGEGWLMAGLAPVSDYQIDATRAVLGRPGQGDNSALTDQYGRARLFELTDKLRGPMTITAGARGYESISFDAFDASEAVVYLRSTDPALPESATLRGQLSEHNDLSSDGIMDVGVIVGNFDLDYLATISFRKILGRYQCWDPVTEGMLGAFINPLAMSSNMDVPGQDENLQGSPVRIEPHAFTMEQFPLGQNNLVALLGKISLQEMLPLLSAGNATFAEVIGLLDMQEIGALRNLDVAGDQNLDIPLTQDLTQSVRCRAPTPPAGADMFCVVAGDWSGADGTGALFPMGLASITAEEAEPDGSLDLILTQAESGGVFANVGRLGAAVLRFSEAELIRATSAALFRPLPLNGRLNATQFLSPPTVEHDGPSITWSPVGGAGEPASHLCKLELVRMIADVYEIDGPDSELCANRRFADWRERVQWSTYLDGDATGFEFPTLFDARPRGADDGFIDPAATRALDELFYRVSCYGLGAVEFDLDAADLGELPTLLRFMTQNTVDLWRIQP